MTGRRFIRPHHIWRNPVTPGVCLALALLVGNLTPVAVADDPANEPSQAGLIRIEGEITPILADSIERRLDEAREAGVDVFIFEMNTPGGRLDAALDIFRMIERCPGRTVAWVNPEAYSAGALISVAADEIWMSPSSSIGDCAPIMVSPVGGVQEVDGTLQAKAESPVLQKFRSAAARKGYDQALSRAMVTVDEEVWWLERIDDPNVREFVDAEVKKARIDDIDEGAEPEWRLVQSYTVDGVRYAPKQPVVGKDELLTMSEHEAVAFGFAKGIVEDVDELATALDATGGVTVYAETGWEVFAAWLNNPLIRGLLLVIVFIGAYLEFQSPGLILPGVTAFIALAIFLAAPYAAGLATLWPIILMVIGLVLLAVELFILPGFGVAGLLGILCIVIGMVVSFVPTDTDLPPLAIPDLQQFWQAFQDSMKVLAGSLAISIVGILLLIRYLPQSRLSAGLILPGGKTSVAAPVDPPEDVAAVGDVGLVTGDLRPGGQARFGQHIVDVKSQGEYVERGRRVQVIRREGMHIFVRPLEDSEHA